MITGEFFGELPMERLFETLARLIGEQQGVSVTVQAICQRAEAPNGSPPDFGS